MEYQELSTPVVERFGGRFLVLDVDLQLPMWVWVVGAVVLAAAAVWLLR
jgi:hypothetical protein